MPNIFSSISEFTGIINSGIARPNRYYIELPNDDGTIGVLCHTCSFPQRTIQTFEIKQRGVPYQVPFTQMYPPINLSFYSLTNMNIRRYFEKWHKQVVLSRGMNVLGTYSRFAKKAYIYLLNRQGTPSYKVTLFDAWPLDIGSIDLSYATNDTYLSVNVTLTYKFWEQSA